MGTGGRANVLRGMIQGNREIIKSFRLNGLRLSPWFFICKPITKIFQPKVFEQFTVTITSFSYTKSYPNDDSGNGGGFVFDCRGIENPGKYDQYKKLTGRDQEVINFFKERTDIDKFIDNVIKTVKPTIDKYIDRNFNSLSISFGCTGGQHRSVYCAERLFEYIHKNYKIGLRLHHRELNIYEP